MAAVEVIGEYFYWEEPIWDAPYDLWLHRIKDIWDELEFIKKAKWGSQM